MKRLYVAISHHGLGHLAQTASVLAELRRLRPELAIIVRTALGRDRLAARLNFPFELVPEASDCNLVMRDAVRVDRVASLAAYQSFHRDWQRRVDAEAERLGALAVDAVFSNVGYLPLAAAQRAGLPAAALCSLNWADIFRHYLGDQPGAPGILDDMGAAYAGARAFLRPQPAMPMVDLANAVAIPPLAQAGRKRRGELMERLRLASETRLVLVAMGGVRYRPPVESWPRRAGIVFIVPDDWQASHVCVRAVADTGMPFSDVLASSDAVVTKPGYGTYAEAAAAGVPVLTLPRPDWPETPYLNAWLGEVGRVLELGEAQLLAGDLAPSLDALWQRPGPLPMPADGARVAARHVLGLA